MKQLSQQDYNEFRQWLQLKETAITWEGKYSQEFNDFWKNFFQDNLYLRDISNRFKFLDRKVQTGPIGAWFKWVESRLLVFLFLYKDFSIVELSEGSDWPLGQVATTIRDFLASKFPHLEIPLSDELSIADYSQSAISLKFSSLKSKYSIMDHFITSGEDEVMTTLEVTLYPEWKEILALLEQSVSAEKRKRLKQFWNKDNTNILSTFVKEVMALTAVGIILVYGILWLNRFYENHLIQKISFFEPDFFKIQTPLKFKNNSLENQNKIDLEISALAQLEVQAEELLVVQQDERFEPESEVALTSIDDLNKEFSTAEATQSEVEETQSQQGGYRDTGMANAKKTYRVLMKSTDPSLIKEKMDTLIAKMGAAQVDKVKPGTSIAEQGLYYNLYVPNKNFKEFLSNVTQLEESAIFVSSTRIQNPPGKQRIFIWVKSI